MLMKHFMLRLNKNSIILRKTIIIIQTSHKKNCYTFYLSCTIFILFLIHKSKFKIYHFIYIYIYTHISKTIFAFLLHKMICLFFLLISVFFITRYRKLYNIIYTTQYRICRFYRSEIIYL